MLPEGFPFYQFVLKRMALAMINWVSMDAEMYWLKLGSLTKTFETFKVSTLSSSQKALENIHILAIAVTSTILNKRLTQWGQ